MQDEEVIQAVNKCLCNITKVNNRFSDIPLVLGGNWAQILPVTPRGTHSNIVNTFYSSCFYVPLSIRLFYNRYASC
jgi:hypothetical protein